MLVLLISHLPFQMCWFNLQARLGCNFWFQLYNKLKSSVKRGNYVSKPFKHEIGTCQACHLSPEVLKIYVNELSDVLSNVKQSI